MDDKITAQIRSRLTSAQPLPAAPALPAGRFVDLDFFLRERDSLWGRTWALVGRDDEVADPGFYYMWEHTSVPLIVIRSADEQVRVFYNSCRHRGAPVVREARGRNRALRCQYHSWTYDTFGRLVSVPDERDFVDLHMEERPLVPLQTEVWGGWTFANPAPGGTAAASLDALAPHLPFWPAGGLRAVANIERAVGVNWKTAAASLARAAVAASGEPAGQLDRSAVELLPGGAASIVVARRAATSGPVLECVDPLARDAVPMLHVFPNLLFVAFPEAVLALAAWPSYREPGESALQAILAIPDWGEEDSPVESAEWSPRIQRVRAAIDDLAVALERGDAGMPFEAALAVHINRTVDMVMGNAVPGALLTPAG